MNRTPAVLLVQIYTLLILLGAAVGAGLERLLPSLALLVVVLAVTLRPAAPRYNIAVDTAVIFLAPLVLAPALEGITGLPSLAASALAVAAAAPVFYLLDHSLKQHTLVTMLPMKPREGLYVSGTFTSLLALTGVVVLVALAVGNHALLLAGGAFVLYLGGIITGIVFTLRRPPLTAMPATARIIAGTSGDMMLDLTNRASTSLHCQFASPEPWLKVAPRAALLPRGRVNLKVNYTPPLAGNSRPTLQSLAQDRCGFVQIYQQLQPLELHIIPRARYAEWLARQYLEQAGSGLTAAALMPLQSLLASPGGTDYRESRSYEPGDRLKDIDWKHTLQLSQLIVKDYASDEEPTAIIAVNLAVADAEDADRLSLKLITAALTLARENIATALTAYNDREVVRRTSISEPDNILRQALSLLREIIPVPMVNRYLELPDIKDIRRNINLLKAVDSEPARRLRDIFDFKYRSIEESTRSHPAAIALSGAAREVPAPATILLVSQLNHDAEAVKVISEKLSRQRFTTVPVETPAPATRR